MKVTVPLGSMLTGQSMSVNRLAQETSPYLLRADNPVASASSCDADQRRSCRLCRRDRLCVDE